MRQYLTDKHKKLILEEYLIESLKDFRASLVDGNKVRSIINIDIATLIEGNKTGLTIVFRHSVTENPFSDIVDTIYKYASKHVPLHIDNNQLVCKPSYTVDNDETIDMINFMLRSFHREYSIDKIL